jgi:hypothetical protein
LKRYLEFGAALSREKAAQTDTQTTGDVAIAPPRDSVVAMQSEAPDGSRSRFAAEIAEELRAHGYLVTADLGLSSFKLDLAVKKQNETHWRTAIILDNPVWGARIAVADRDGVSELLKQLKGWKSIARVWLPGWIRDREGETKRLIDIIESAGMVADEAVSEAAGAASDMVQGGASEEVMAAAGAAPDMVQGGASEVVMADAGEGIPYFSCASTEKTHAKHVLNNLRNSYPIVCGIGQEVLRTEGPIALARLITIVYKRCGYTRIGSEKQRELAAIIRREFSIDTDDFVWPAGMDPQIWHGVRRTKNREDRAVNEISKEEIINAIELVLRESLSAERGELIAETARRLGYERIGTENKAWIEKALVRGLAESRFNERDGRLSS